MARSGAAALPQALGCFPGEIASSYLAAARIQAMVGLSQMAPGAVWPSHEVSDDLSDTGSPYRSARVARLPGSPDAPDTPFWRLVLISLRNRNLS